MGNNLFTLKKILGHIPRVLPPGRAAEDKLPVGRVDEDERVRLSPGNDRRLYGPEFGGENFIF